MLLLNFDYYLPALSKNQNLECYQIIEGMKKM